MWHKSSSTIKPEAVEPVLGGRYLLHRNIEEVEKVDEGGKAEKLYTYEERLVDELEYQLIKELEAREQLIDELQGAVTELAGFNDGNMQEIKAQLNELQSGIAELAELLINGEER